LAAEEVLRGQSDCDEVSPRNRFRRVGSRVRVTDVCGTPGGWPYFFMDHPVKTMGYELIAEPFVRLL
jgi:hypothetical protein